MGYYTNYSVSFINNEVEQPEKTAELQEVENCNLNQQMKAQLIQMIEYKYSSQKMDRNKLVRELDGRDCASDGK